MSEKHVKAADYVRKLITDNAESKKGLHLTGATRTGKTSLAVAALRLAASNAKTVRFLTHERFSAHIRERVLASQLRLSDVDQWMDEWQEMSWLLTSVYEVLVLDDIGRSGTPDFVRDEVAGLVRHRGDADLLTILTSNLTSDQFGAQYDERFIEYLRTEYYGAAFVQSQKVK